MPVRITVILTAGADRDLRSARGLEACMLVGLGLVLGLVYSLHMLEKRLHDLWNGYCPRFWMMSESSSFLQLVQMCMVLWESVYQCCMLLTSDG